MYNFLFFHEVNIILLRYKTTFQIQNLTHMFDLPVLKEAVKSEDKQKVYVLVFPEKSVGVYFNLKYILLLR